MGAWIEIVKSGARPLGGDVAPLVGAWIEIKLPNPDGTKNFVAPLVGAWIEIKFVMPHDIKTRSLPLWERGLKLVAGGKYIRKHSRSPCGSVD